jgi:hypothetical protein
MNGGQAPPVGRLATLVKGTALVDIVIMVLGKPVPPFDPKQ